MPLTIHARDDWLLDEWNHLQENKITLICPRFNTNNQRITCAKVGGHYCYYVVRVGLAMHSMFITNPNAGNKEGGSYLISFSTRKKP
jgi:hypothetical protein